ncbi:MAG: DUF937 domain-containing protein [Verrucomicrobiaceae bacterium]|jgi:uncharacterized protein YidB (DUF937 family)|nr:DUF937 domain-containing protein [Verrucomicrobiaceae bacterium]
MGLLDSLAKNALGGMLGGSLSKQDPASMLAELLGNAGGLEGLMGRFQQAGFGAHFESWVSTSENQTMDQDQLRSALGDEAIERLTGKMGGRAETLLPLLAQFLPQVIDKLTPSGKIDNNTPSGSQLQSVLTSVITSNLGSLLGKR